MTSSGSLSKLLGFVDPAAPKVCLDIGCGTGQLTRELNHRGYKCLGIDVSTRAIEVARAVTLSPDLMYMRFNIEEDDVRNLPFAPYGLIVCKLVYVFIKDKPKFLERVHQLLGPDGIFVVVTPHRDDLPKEQAEIGVDDGAMASLVTTFDQIALYKERDLIYFVGRKY